MGEEGGSADFHPTHNSRYKKCYFLMIFNIRKMLYFHAVGGVLGE